jgi:hypothetical protein
MGLKRKRDWTKPLTKLELYQALGDWKQIPFPILKEVIQLDYIHKSPCSLSFYSKPKDWGFTEHQTIRYSNHWNFKSTRTGQKIHSKTEIPIFQDVWAKGIYDSSTDIFTILEIYKDEPVTKEQMRELYQTIYPDGDPFRPKQEYIEILKRFSADVKLGKVFFKLNGSLQKVNRITRTEIILEGDIILDRKDVDDKTFSTFTLKYPDFCIVYNGVEYSEKELYNNHFLHGKQTAQEN